MTAPPATSRGDTAPQHADPAHLLDRLLQLEDLEPDGLGPGVVAVIADALPGVAAELYRWVDDNTMRLCATTDDGDRGSDGPPLPVKLLVPKADYEQMADSVAHAALGPLPRRLADQLNAARRDSTASDPTAWIIEGGTGPWGLLFAAAVTRSRLTQQETHLLATCARWLSAAIRRADLAELVREQERELSRRSRAEDLIVAVAHDFYNFLTPLSSRIELMRRRAGLEERRRDFQDANRAAKSVERLTDMVTDLFDAQRLASGTFVLHTERADLAALVRDTVEAFETGGPRITVTGMRSLDVVCDPRRVRQAVENLLANAVKASEKTGLVTVAVGVETRGASPLAVVTVGDDGPGIPRDVMPRLFVRFAAGADSTGLGLGLYLANEIARAHGGDITVESEAGKGSQFHFAIPAGW